MRFEVLLFAAAREAVDADRITVELPDSTPATAGALLAALAADPRLEAIVRRARLAVDQRFALNDTPVSPEQELALIPPVGGG